MKRPLVSLSVLKQKAKQIKKEKSISQHQALNEAVKEIGFSNYKHYLKALEESKMQAEASQRVGQQMIASRKRGEIFKKVESLIPILQSLKLPFAEFINSVTQEKRSEDALRAICEQKPDLKKYLELHFLKEFLVDAEGEIDFEAPYHIAKKVSVKNLVYKTSDMPIDDVEDEDGGAIYPDINEGTLYLEGEYALTLEFAFDYDRDDKENPEMLKDRQMWGSFELTVDKDANISIENMDIGWSAW